MKGLRRETCVVCEAETGKAGPGDGSIYVCDGGLGPLCDECYGVLREEVRTDESSPAAPGHRSGPNPEPDLTDAELDLVEQAWTEDFEVPAGLQAVERLLAEVRRSRADVAQLVAALHALVQVHHDAQRHHGKWSECREPACVEAQVALLERAREAARG